MWSTRVKDPSKSTRGIGSDDLVGKHAGCNDPQTLSLAKTQCIVANLKAQKKKFCNRFHKP